MPTDMQDFFDRVYGDLPRQAPGSRHSTRRAYDAIPSLRRGAIALDVGCGTGGQTCTLAELHNGPVVAIDNLWPFLPRLQSAAQKKELAIQPACMSMDRMGFAEGSLDLIWSEGALYSIGFDQAAAICRSLLKPGGYLAATELVWLTNHPPESTARFFESEYPTMQSREAVANRLQEMDFALLDSFALPDKDWWDEYYSPLSRRLDALRETFAEDAQAIAYLDAMLVEMDVRRRHPDTYGYVFYILRNESR